MIHIAIDCLKFLYKKISSFGKKIILKWKCILPQILSFNFRQWANQIVLDKYLIKLQETSLIYTYFWIWTLLKGC